MANLNQCQFIGNVVRQPEVKYTASGDAICNFSVAVNETWKDRNTGEKKESAEFVRAVAYRKIGEICGEYLQQGMPVWIQGKMKTRKWQGQDGKDNYTTEIIIDQMQMLGGRGEASSGGGRGQQNQRRAPAQNLTDMEDDLPPF